MDAETNELNDLLEGIREILIGRLEREDPRIRVLAFSEVFAGDVYSTMQAGADLSTSLCTHLLGLLHACARHPEWLKAVVEDNKWFKELYDEEEYEEITGRYIESYPLRLGL